MSKLQWNIDKLIHSDCANNNFMIGVVVYNNEENYLYCSSCQHQWSVVSHDSWVVSRYDSPEDFLSRVASESFLCRSLEEAKRAASALVEENPTCIYSVSTPSSVVRREDLVFIKEVVD